jgi:serine/threonine protein kinase
MGRVYLARSSSGRTVAVKTVRADLAADASFRGRFRREVEAARAIVGPWTAPVLDADTEAAVPWLATGYVLGPSLWSAVSEHGALPERSVRALGAGLAEALTGIHTVGIVHRDLKPANVLLAAVRPLTWASSPTSRRGAAASSRPAPARITRATARPLVLDAKAPPPRVAWPWGTWASAGTAQVSIRRA